MRALMLSTAFLALTLTLTAQELWFPAGPPELVEPSKPVAAADQLLLTREQYERLAQQAAQSPGFVPLTELPPALSANARFGINLVWGGKNRGFVVDGSDASYTLYADLNGNGSLRDDVPMVFERREEYFTVLVRVTSTERIAGEMASVPVSMRISVVPKEGELQHARSVLMIRRGVAQVGKRSVAFALRGIGGVYDNPTNALWLDLNGDGIGMGDRESGELLLVRDEQVNIDGIGYRFRVDHFGRSLSLTPLGASVPDRPSLSPRSVAPDFSVRDLQGREHTLRAYRGKPIMLYFWAVWCGPCVVDAPTFRSLAQTYPDLAVIGIAPNDAQEIEAFARSAGHAWPQVSEGDQGPFHRLYRVVGYPTHVLIGRDGRVVAHEIGGIADRRVEFERQLATMMRR